jgi:serine/threonine protein kinase
VAAALAASLLLLPAPARAAQPFACASLSGAAATQCTALGDVYIALNGSSWRSRAGWAQAAGSGQAPDVCAFFGVTCDGSGAVTQLCVPQAKAQGWTACRADGGVAVPQPACSRLARPARRALARNLLRGYVPESLGNLTSLTALLLGGNFIFGTLPTGLVAQMPALRNLSVADNFLEGALPAGLAALPAGGLALSKNNFTSAGLDAALCPVACASASAFACPFAASACNCSAAPACRGTCSVGVTFGSLAVQCGDPNTACVTCMSALITPYLLAGVQGTDVAMLGTCIVGDDAKLLRAGADPAALDTLRACEYTRIETDAVCPVRLADADALRIFSAAAQNVCSPTVVSATFAPCEKCAVALGTPFLDLGAPNDFDVLSECYNTHLSLMLQAGITTNTLALLASCVPELYVPSSRAKADSAVLGGAVGGSLGGAAVLVAAAVVMTRRSRALSRRLPGPGGYGGAHLHEPSDLSVQSSQAPGASLLLRADDLVLGALMGRGGFACVYAARWRGSAVAAKVFMLRSDAVNAHPLGIAAAMDSYVRYHVKSEAHTVDDERKGAAYELELQLLQSLRHPNICTLYGVVVAPPTLVIELCVGGSLAALLRVSTLDTLPWTRRADIGAGVACGVDFLHSQDPPVIHRDLKSANVVLTADGTAKLVDFGLGGFLPHVAGEMASRDKAAKGTLAYMPPELIMSISGATPQAVDIFGVGVVLHDLVHLGIFSTPPASSSSSSSSSYPSADALLPGPGAAGSNESGQGMAVLLERHTSGYAVKVASHCPKALGEIMLRCMRREPATRPPAGEVLLAMLQVAQQAQQAADRGESWR